MAEIVNRALLILARALSTTVRGSVSVVEVLALVICIVATAGVLINGWDSYKERRRAIPYNGIEETLARGDWRRAVTDSVKILAFIAIVGVASRTPPAVAQANRTRSVWTTLLLLVILGGIAYNQVNNYLTRRKAKGQLLDIKRRLRESGC